MSTHSFVAHFLKQNNYLETLKAFEKEHGSPISTETGHDESLDQIIQDRVSFSKDFEILDLLLNDANQAIVDQELPNWSTPYPSTKYKLKEVTGLTISAAIVTDKVIASSNDGSISIYDYEGNRLSRKERFLGGVVAKSVVSVGKNDVLIVGMNGNIYLCRLEGDELVKLFDLALHKGLVVDCGYAEVNQNRYFVTIGWDKMVKLVKISKDKIEEIATYKLTLAGTCIGVCGYNGSVIVVLGRTESTLLDVLALENLENNVPEMVPVYKISLNDAEFMANGFTPRCISIAQGKTKPLIAVATSQEPFMRVIIVSLSKEAIESKDNKVRRGQILTNTNSMAPQDKFSQPLICWRQPHASGVWAFGEDGIIRCLDVKKQQVVAAIDGHKGRVKCVAMGTKMVTFGADKKAYRWTEN
ncbi:hypothetical protein QFC19_005321 [Naganishia cerealis]|uniref:Uncharacterized protein n=1 Tax=Naganishia cerealis TaxID=610337 RepID=A0ACC2VRU6_9TREE|nr:hypothetical protein QFC19_005321 [Naganishia cerealis]